MAVQSGLLLGKKQTAKTTPQDAIPDKLMIHLSFPSAEEGGGNGDGARGACCKTVQGMGMKPKTSTQASRLQLICPLATLYILLDPTQM